MKKKIRILTFLSLLICMVLFAPQVSEGAKSGLLLWFNQVLPVLFPFSFILQWILTTDIHSAFIHRSGLIMRHLFHLPPVCSFYLFTGFVCGFPMGAAVVTQAFENKQLGRDEAQLLSAVCNQASPMFLTGYVLNQALPEHPHRFWLIVIFYVSPFLWLWIRRSVQHLFGHSSLTDQSIHTTLPGPLQPSFRNILLKTSELMLKIGVCMMFFSIFQNILTRIPLIHSSVSALIALLLEITTGVMAIHRLPWPEWLKTVCIMAGTSFGGLCIACQSYTVLRPQKLSFIQYLADKSAVGMITAALVWILYQIV